MRDVAVKKVVAPNIPQRRIKIKQETLEYNEKPPSNVREQVDVRKERFRRGRGARVYIQTGGSFLEDGPAFAPKKALTTDYQREKIIDSTLFSIPRPWLTIKLHAPLEYRDPCYERVSRSSSSRSKSNADVKIERKQIYDLLENYDENDVFPYNENDLNPVQIPFLKMKHAPKIKEEILDVENIKPVIKKEQVDAAENLNDTEVKFFERTLKQETPSKIVDNLFREDTLMLLQLPTCLFFEKSHHDVNQPAKKGATSIQQEGKDDNPQNNIAGANFKDAPEGYLGKLQVLKSGRMRLVFGSISLAVDLEVNEERLSEVVSIPVEDKNGDFIVLGKVSQRIIPHPILEDFKSGTEKEKIFE
ncbi:DNA-directed RNA polymerase III subunit RPC4 [Caerostris extrusa]|uniref:DNA-directed RNA polymerase III subunit RPC4 n=1 Tax=Caerostris extrusa TaxID=172846 RepID=A0AAV4XJY1_CAEEX|nr:DNA-directed RNA polymerase III subunit RPC4 [Caerostris extrusa]